MLNPDALAGLLVDNRYRLQNFLGNGAFGYVFAAEEIVLGKILNRVAVKLIRPQNPKHREDVLQEIAALANLSHAHLLGYRTAGEIALGNQKLIFLASELAESSLEEWLVQSTPTPTELLIPARQIAGALVYLGQRNVSHRDIKPANILCVGGNWKLADFGLARVAAANVLHQTAAAGTLPYMAPEAIDGEVGPPGDVWALGVLLQECLTGQFPYSPDTQLQFIRQVASQPPFIAPNLAPPFDAVVKGCLVKDFRQRWTAQRVLDALENRAQNQSPTIPFSPAPPNSSTPPAPVRLQANADYATVRLARHPDEPVVCATGNATYRSIGEALAQIAPGARLWIRPGIYRENLILEKSVQLCGEGEREAIIIEASNGNCLKIPAGIQVAVSGLTLNGRAKAIGKKYYAVSVAGEATLENCIVSSDSLACLAAQGDGAILKMIDCRIIDGASDGVLLASSAQGVLQRCEISGHAQHGLHLRNHASATVEDCELAQNHKCGARIGDNCHALLQRCYLHHNKQQAVNAERTARGAIEACRLQHNKFGSWDIASGSAIQRSANKED